MEHALFIELFRWMAKMINALKQPAWTSTNPVTRHVFTEPRVNSAAIEHYLQGLSFPATRSEILRYAEANYVPENILAFFRYRLPEKLYPLPSDVSFTSFVSAYFFGQD